MNKVIPLFLALSLFATLAPAATDTELISLDLKEADILDVLRYFSEISSLNLVIDPGVSGRVTVRLLDLPWWQAFEVVLTAHGLAFDLQDNVMWIAPIDVLVQRQIEEATLEDQKRLAEPLTTAIIRVSYADANTIAEIVRQTALSPRGNIVVDQRTSSLIVTDIESNLPRTRLTTYALDR